MNAFWQQLWSEAAAASTVVGLGVVLVAVLLQRALSVGPMRWPRAVLILVALHGVALVAAALLQRGGVELENELRLVARLCFAYAAVLAVAGFLFVALLPRLRVVPSRILQDLGIAAALVIATGALTARAGFNITGLIATSAVVTAVIGLSLQDTLGNTIGGLALQLDDSIHVGDWIKVGDVTGRVTEIRWRYTALETRNWETVLLPNSALVKGSVIVLGRRTGQPRLWRRWVYFHVDYRTPPSDVIDVVTQVLQRTPIQHVAKEPAPNVVLMDFTDSTARYAARYWLMDLAVDDPTDSEVRTRIYFALKRADIPLAIPAHAVFLTEEGKKRKEHKLLAEHERRKEALVQVEIFAGLTDDERGHLAEGLRHAPFTKGEVLTRQGSEAHWLYLIVDGEVSVRVAHGGAEREVARLGKGEVFGEMSLMTGSPRAASVTALTDVECYRLDKGHFQDVLRTRPDLAEPIAALLATRKLNLDAAKVDLDVHDRARAMERERDDLLGKIRGFFGLS